MLKHELTHSFVRQITMGHCPTWFNEGLAQLEEGATTATMGSQLARAIATGTLAVFPVARRSLPEYATGPGGPCLRQVAWPPSSTSEPISIWARSATSSRRCPLSPTSALLLQDKLHLTYPAFEQEVAGLHREEVWDVRPWSWVLKARICVRLKPQRGDLTKPRPTAWVNVAPSNS